MADLTTNDKQVLEKIFQMESGYVLDFTNQKMSEFFSDDVKVNIDDEKYNYASGSKANRMKGFWRIANNSIVGKSIIKLIEYIENQILIDNLDKSNFPEKLLRKGKEIGDRLTGVKTIEKTRAISEDEFLSKEFSEVSVARLKLDGTITNVLEQRLKEIELCLNAKASLGSIFLCGSTLEGILLGIASNNPKKFNNTKSSPKDKNGKVLQFQSWTLGNLINTAKETGFVDEDVKKFSHALRDFRNYIHPYEQSSKQFNPDEHTARLCWQVLKTAISQISKKI